MSGVRVPLPSRPPVRYYGSKWRLAPWILSHFPAHTCYVEPYAGGANVLLRKLPVTYEVYNDLDREVVHFFRTLREHTADLLRAIDLTPYSRLELDEAYEATDDPLERARRFYVRSWQAFHPGQPNQRTGWRRQTQGGRGKSVVKDWNDTARLLPVVERLKHVQIECDTAEAVIRNFDGPDTLFYLDPPYLTETRCDKWADVGYAEEMDAEGHRSLAVQLIGIQGMAAISGYPSVLYEELFAGWRRVEKRAYTNGNVHRIEALWLSPALVERVNTTKARTLPMFESAKDGAR